MKRHLLFALLFTIISFNTNNLMAQKVISNAPFESQWTAIDSLIDNGLYKSTKEALEALELLAKKDKQQAHEIKALVYLTQINSTLEEQGDWQAILALEDALANAIDPVSHALLANVLAQKYSKYYQQSYWQIRDRTQTDAAPTSDETTWTAADFLERITDLYLISVEETATRTEALADYACLAEKGENTEAYYSTLYELLLDKALDYFRNNDAFLNEASYHSAFDKLALLAPAKDFVQLTWPAVERTSSTQLLIEILQAGLAWKTAHATPLALVEFDLRRLDIVYRNLQVAGKRNAYESALNHLQKKYNTQPQSLPLVLLAQMEYYQDRARYYNKNTPETQVYRWDYKKAMAIGNDLVSSYKGSPQAKRAAYIMQQIKAASYSVEAESVSLPNEYGLLHVKYSNVSDLHFRIYSIDVESYHNINKDREQKLKALLAQKAVQTWSESLPDAGDYRSHTAESSFAPLKKGVYALAISPNAAFEWEKGKEEMSFIFFWVSELGLLTKENEALERTQAVVVNRKTGAPVAAAEVMQWNWEGNELKRKVVTHKSNADGMVTLSPTKRNATRIEVTHKDDRLFAAESKWLGSTSYHGRKRKHKSTYFFLDRGLYRPGQTLYFKALCTEKEDAKGALEQIAVAEQVRITLYDANDQIVKEEVLTTNEYGTIQGSFVLPSEGLTGRMYLLSNYGFGGGGGSFRVEEYKRPRFEVNIDSLEGAAKLGEQVEITGLAAAYAGTKIADAEVVYSVSRSTYYPWCRYYYQPTNSGTPIAQGTAKTDSEGRFSFDFEALADAASNAKYLPVYQFEIKVDVVDITGETRSATKTIKLAKHPLELAVKLGEEQDKNKTIQIDLASHNLDAKAVAIAAELKIEALDMPKKDWINRYWSLPDTQLMSQSVFEKRFPLYLYNRTARAEEAKALRTIWNEKLDFSGNKQLEIDAKKWAVGHYRCQLSTIMSNGDTLSTAAYFELNDWKARDFVYPSQLRMPAVNKMVEPGQKAIVELASVKDAHYVLVNMSNRKEDVAQYWLRPKSNQQIEYQVQEADRGNVIVNMLYVKNNRVHTDRHTIKVPWTNKELKITYEQMRSKLYPGAAEEWIVKIDGASKDELAAELVAAMYDASLDQIVPYNWNFDIYPHHSYSSQWEASYFRSLNTYPKRIATKEAVDNIWFKLPALIPLQQFAFRNRRYRNAMVEDGAVPMMMTARSNDDGNVPPPPPPPPPASAKAATAGFADIGDIATFDPQALDLEQETQTPVATEKPPLKVRTDLSETAFFFPNLYTDKEGRIVLKFKAPEALTKWKLQLFAHDQSLAFALDEATAVTQKELMVLPSAPRFVRQGDRLRFPAKVSNLSDKAIRATCRLELFDVQTDENLAQAYQLTGQEQSLSLAAGASEAVFWDIQVPEQAQGVLGYRVIAEAADFSDGEEAAIPVLSNGILLTESLPLFVKGNKKSEVTLEHLAASTASTKHQSFTLEMTTNPAWMAIKALPYLQEYPYDCTEQLVNKYFANTLAAKIVADNPKLKAVFEAWKRDPNSLKSPLMLNEELKSALLAETPWVLEAQSEQEQRERIALLFDLNNVANAQAATLRTIIQRQSDNGGFAWFPGGRNSWYVTQYVLEQLSHLRQLVGDNIDHSIGTLLTRALSFCDKESTDYYKRLELKEEDKDRNYLTSLLAHYLYTRSFHADRYMEQDEQQAYDFWWKEAEEHVFEMSLQSQALIAIAAKQSNREALANRVYASLQERVIRSKELGMYWKYDYGYFWHQLPIETHTLLMELYGLMGADAETLDELKLWLLRQKETNRWETTKSTAAAVYTLMSTGTNWLAEQGNVSVSFPNWSAAAYTSKLSEAQATAEAGTGYYKVQWNKEAVKSEMASVALKNHAKVPAWGAIHWQYFENIDKVKSFEQGPLKLEREIYKKVTTDEGTKLERLTKAPKLGDQLTVRLVVRTDRDMEFVHLKDLRAAGLEPIEQLSGYRWASALGYYFSSKDVATHFFIDYLPKGEYVLEYDLRVFHEGDFSAGLASLQCMYAPKFNSHSQGQRLEIK